MIENLLEFQSIPDVIMGGRQQTLLPVSSVNGQTDDINWFK